MMRRLFTAVLCLAVAVIVNAQFTEAGFYRVHNVGSDSFICIKDTKFKKTTDPDAFWPCIKMLQDSAQISDPGSIIYIPNMGQASLYAQGVNTYSLTGLMLEIDTASVREGGKETYIAKTQYGSFPCIFRDYGNGLTAGYLEKPESRWWIEPVNAGSMDTSYFGVMPINEDVKDAEGWFWATLCCDFPFTLPEGGGVEGAYTVKEIKKGVDDLYYAEPVKVCGQGETVPAMTPVLLKCKASYASGNKLIPTGDIANCRTMPIASNLLMGNYFSNFMNHGHLTNFTVFKEYIPDQATMASAEYLALGVDADGKLGFFPQEDSTYMAANSAWLSTKLMTEEISGLTAVYLGQAPEPEPEPVLGDANGDGALTIKDVTCLIDYLLSVDNDDNAKEEIDVKAADLNDDGKITVKDLTLLIELLLEQ